MYFDGSLKGRFFLAAIAGPVQLKLISIKAVDIKYLQTLTTNSRVPMVTLCMYPNDCAHSIINIFQEPALYLFLSVCERKYKYVYETLVSGLEAAQ